MGRSTAGSPENTPGPLEKGKTSSKPSFSGTMLSFRGVTVFFSWFYRVLLFGRQKSFTIDNLPFLRFFISTVSTTSGATAGYLFTMNSILTPPAFGNWHIEHVPSQALWLSLIDPTRCKIRWHLRRLFRRQNFHDIAPSNLRLES